MKKKTIILGIESSCDETAASIIEENDQGIPTILSNIISIFSICDLAASSGTTPPNSLCTSTWLDTMLDKIEGIP